MNTEKPPPQKPYLSLQWKILILIFVIFFCINGLQGIFGYRHLEQFFEQQLGQSIEKNADALLWQARQNLLKLAAAVSLPAEKQSGSMPSYSQLSQHFDNNFETLQLDHGVEGVALYNMQTHEEKHWGINEPSKNLHQMITGVYVYLEPETTIDCQETCQIYAATPLLMDNGDTMVLTLSTSLIDFIIQFSYDHLVDIALLRSGQDDADAERIWDHQLIGITNKQRSLKALRTFAKHKSLDSLFKQGISYSLDNKTLYFHAMPIGYEDNNLLILMTDITSQTNAIYNSLLITASFLGVGIITIMSALFLVLRRPLKRITKQAELLPLLAKSGFAAVRYEIQKNQRKVHIQDELDVLESTAMSLSYQLEQLEQEIGHRTSELETMALYDPLTGLANRRLFTEQVSKQLKNSRNNGQIFAVVFIDLDNFKRVNDSLGHDAGDDLLKEIARRLGENVRPTDLVARLGGDEFTLILPDVQHIDNVRMIMDKILLSFQAPITVASDKEIAVTPSIGIVIGPQQIQNVSELMRYADLAMYSAKQQGKNCYHFFDQNMNEEIQQSLRLEKEIIQAINDFQFRLYYQPIVDLDSGRIIYLEGLLRWNHPQKGLIYPGSFIDMLEESGQIMRLGPQIFEMACLAIKVLDSCKLDDITIALNISAKQLADPDFIEKLLTMVEQTRIQPNRIQLEITESTLMKNLEHQSFLLGKLQKLGFRIAIDDFGIGYSSLTYLKSLPIDILKIDRSFIKDMPFDQHDIAISSAIIAMAQKLGLDVVAEGIETTEQENTLKQLGCKYGQGFLYQKPEPLESFIGSLKTNAQQTKPPSPSSKSA